MQDAGSLATELAAAARVDPFLPVATGVFALAILHAFAAPVIGRFVRGRGGEAGFRGVVGHWVGEVEVAFALWAIVALGLLAVWPGKGFGVAGRYLLSVDYAAAVQGVVPAGPSKFLEPLFVFIIMALASARPVLALANRLLGAVAGMFGGSPAAHWAALLTLAPLLGSLITEPAAMTIAALLLARRFFACGPSEALKYATLALLFVNVSVGGALTSFAAPPIVMVAGRWGWGWAEVAGGFGVGAIATIVLANTAMFLVFRRELLGLRPVAEESREEATPPVWLTLLHLVLIGAAVAGFAAHQVLALIGVLLAFLFLRAATPRWQDPLRLRGPFLVGCFLAGLVVLGGLQAWWIGPALPRLGETALLASATVLTAFNDNAAITYLAAQVPALAVAGPAAEALRHAVVAGALAGGGLTVIANAPNPAGQSILAPFFAAGVSPWKLLRWALLPTLLAVACLGWLR
jgi:hypothetical protein